MLWTREVIALRRAPFAEQLDALVRVFSNDEVVRTSLDQTGMGEAVVEQAQARHGREYAFFPFMGPRGLVPLRGVGRRPTNPWRKQEVGDGAAPHKPLAKTRGGGWGSAPCAAAEGFLSEKATTKQARAKGEPPFKPK